MIGLALKQLQNQKKPSLEVLWNCLMVFRHMIPLIMYLGVYQPRNYNPVLVSGSMDWLHLDRVILLQLMERHYEDHMIGNQERE